MVVFLLNFCRPRGYIRRRDGSEAGFTLIELSIVLVIIGLIVGGILVGQDLIRAAEVRAQIAQIERYNTAVNTFRGKYGYLPGDMPPTPASQFGFNVGTNCDASAPGMRNGDGLIDGEYPFSLSQGEGETALFWQDLSTGKYIDGTFPTGAGGATFNCYLSPSVGSTQLNTVYPPGKIGRGNYVYVYESSGVNWWGLSAVTQLNSSGTTSSGPSIPVIQAYNIDKKIDDGLPTTGRVIPWLLDGGTVYSSPLAVITPTAVTCYTVNSGYSIMISGGANPNCALSFQFQ